MAIHRLSHKGLPLLPVLFPLQVLYLTNLQTIPNGCSHYLMIDVGETLIVLNEWGSLHPTGYPLFVISGNVLTAILRSIGIAALVAPALVSLLWGVLALLLLYMVALRLAFTPWLAAGAVLLFELTGTVWIHNLIAEIYSFNLLLLLLLLYLDRLGEITLVDHNAYMQSAFLTNKLVTPDYIFFNQPQEWWESRLGQPVWLEGAGPGLVRLHPAPVIRDAGHHEITDHENRLHCSSGELVLEVLWNAGENPPAVDLRVFVKTFAADGNLLAQGDQLAPVYGLRPTSEWQANEQVLDFYPASVSPDQVHRVEDGLYRAEPDGEFQNVLERALQPAC